MIYPKLYMMFRTIAYKLTNKSSIIVICIIGVMAVSYGMLTDHNLIFIIGLILVFIGYLLIRRKIKESVRNNPS
jgi:amino acid transporter